MSKLQQMAFQNMSFGLPGRTVRKTSMLASSAIPALVLTGMAAAPTPLVAQSQSCTTSPSTSGQNYLIVCRGNDGNPGPEGSIEHHAGPGDPGNAPSFNPITLDGDYTGESGQSTITIHGFGGTGGQGGLGGDGNLPGGTGGQGGNGGTINLTIQAGAIGDGGNAMAPVSLIANAGQGGEGGNHGGSGGKGGAGGNGGTGGSVNMLLGNAASIVSTKANVAAIDIQAFGGNGGAAYGSEFFSANQKSNPGGNAGQGGAIGSAVAPFAVAGSITSAGWGILARSIGGNGGTGGDGTDSTLNSAGGDGGDGASGGAVYIINQGGTIKAGSSSNTITVSDPNATVIFDEATAAIQAISQGGNGGAGGPGHGGFGGGTGGNGGTVSSEDNPVVITNDHGAISTTGELSAGMLAQNLGGSGGDGASGSGWFVSKGGNGAGGGSAGAVTLIGLGTRQATSDGNFTVQGTISTLGDYSAGMAAQSIGGGGGFGGAATAQGTIATVSIGGKGNNGGNGGSVTVSNGALDSSTGLWSGGNSISTSGNYALGIIAQSIGGGGGNGGAVKSESLGPGATVAVGGSGGNGGIGGAVTINNGEAIATMGSLAYGVVAQSIGGGGGNGGGAFGFNAGTLVQAVSAVGGSGGNGGKGGAVNIANSSTIVTSGAGAFGVVAQSIGGGGGNGGTATTALLSANDPALPSIALTATVGGHGGTGGDAGAVSMTNSGSVITNGTGAWGVLLQSIGGGGGNGGDADSLAIAARANGAQVNVSVGGTGGAGGVGGAVNLLNNNNGLIETHGDDSYAIFAQSIGGGGGNGGSASARQINIAGGNNDTDLSANLNLAIGGSGGSGNVGGGVTIDNVNGTVFTTGTNAKAIFAQSVGGGGGWAGGASAMGSGGSSAKFTATVGVGGAGGAGGEGGNVSITNGGTIYTSGANSAAIYAQSVGGGGGTGGSGAGNSGADGNVQLVDYLAGRVGANGDLISLGNNVWGVKTQVNDAQDQLGHLKELAEAYEAERKAPDSVDWLEKGVSQLTVNLGGGFGGKGGGGGDGGDVTIINSGLIWTERAYSDAIFAQSIGGGGGDGGASHSASDSTAVNANLAVGGGGGSGGNGGDLTVTNSEDITTSGDMSHAINAQSVGGGGGRGGVSVGTSGESGEFSLSIGGDGGAHGDGGTVTINAGGVLATGAATTVGINPTGAGSIGILAQSVGGGGGEVTVLGSQEGQAGAAESSYSWGELLPHLPTIKIGGSPAGNDTVAAGGNGGAVDINLTGTIATSGKDAYGILAQSIGGGGGVVFSPITMADKSNPEAMFGDGNMYGFGDAVSVSLGGSASITTQGDGAVGILAQSIGGGGGLIGGMSGVDVTAVATTSSTLHWGNGGNVTVSAVAGSKIETLGARAHGIVAQSASGGGFFAGNSAAGFSVSTTTCGSNCSYNPVAVNVTLNGEVTVHGAGSYGVFAQNRGGPSGATVSVEVNSSGSIIADKQSAGAVYIDNPGGASTITNYDYIIGGGVTPVAVNGTAATIDNHFYLSGDLLTTSGSHVVNNYSEASLLPASRIVASALNNMAGGTLVIGYAANTSATLTGNLNNNGWIVFNMPASGTPASLTVNGTATLSSGSFIGILGSPVQVEKFTALTASTLNAASGLTAGQVQFPGDRFSLLPNPTFGFTLAINGNVLTVTPQLNTSSQLGISLTANEAATADHLSAAFAAGNAGYSRTAFEGIYQKAPTAPDYKKLLDEIGGHTLGAMMSSRLPLQRAFIDNMMSCPDFAGDGTAVYETSCVWGRFQQSWISNDHDAGFHADSQRYQIGVQAELSEGWFIGASGAYEDETINSSAAKAHLRGDLFSLGALVKRVTGNWTFAASATGTIGNFDTRRLLSISDTPATASPRTQGIALQARAAYQIPMAGWYLRPALAVTGHYLHLDAFAEMGSDFPLRVAPAGNWTLAVAPSLEIGGRITLGKTMLRPFVRGGAVYERKNDWSHQASLVNSRIDLGSYMSQIELPDWSGTAAVGLDAYAGERLTLRLEYSGELNSDNRAHSATLKLGYRF